MFPAKDNSLAITLIIISTYYLLLIINLNRNGPIVVKNDNEISEYQLSFDTIRFLHPFPMFQTVSQIIVKLN